MFHVVALRKAPTCTTRYLTDLNQYGTVFQSICGQKHWFV